MYKEIFSRNIGFLTEAEQETLRAATVGIAGVGGVGGLLAERLIRLGIGHLKISDPGEFAPSNLNRQMFSSTANVGRGKAEVIRGQLLDISPEARIDSSGDGIRTQEDAEAFVAGCSVVVDEMDFGSFKESVGLQRAARGLGTYYLFAYAVGFGGMVVVFDPRGMTLEEYDCLDPGAELDDIEQADVPLDRVCPVIPSYASSMPSDVVGDILSGARGAPTTSVGVGLASILGANEVLNILLGKREIICAPRYACVDLMDRTFVVGRVS